MLCCTASGNESGAQPFGFRTHECVSTTPHPIKKYSGFSKSWLGLRLYYYQTPRDDRATTDTRFKTKSHVGSPGKLLKVLVQVSTDTNEML